MNLPKIMLTTLCVALTGLSSSSLLANAVHGLQALSDTEMNHIVLVSPPAQTNAEQRALQHRVYEIEQDLQHFAASPNILNHVDWQPTVKLDDLPALSPRLQAHVENIAQGLQSDDPRQGLHIMIQGFEEGIHLEHVTLNLFGLGGFAGLGLMNSVSEPQRQAQPIQTVNKAGVTEANRNLLPFSQR